MNEIENKQIEELARDIYEQKSCDTSFEGNCEILAYDLVTLGYKNCKDKVVLSKEEWEVLHNDYAKSLYNARQDERKKMQEENGQLRLENNDLEAENDKLKEELRQASELNTENIKLEQQSTARDIINYVRYSFIHNRREFLKDLEELAKEYGVEVE